MAYIFHNYMEEIVVEKVDEIIDTLDCCNCARCRLDIIAYTLNRMPAKYVVSAKGEVLSRLNLDEFQFNPDLVSVIVNASRVVKQHPNHEKAEVN